MVNSGLEASECAEISQTPLLRYLEVLDLSCNDIGLPGLSNLFGAQNQLKNVKELILFKCNIGEGSTDFPLSQLPKLKTLNLSFNPGAVARLGPTLTQKLFAQSLQKLILVQSAVTQACVLTHLGPNCPNLTFLDLTDNQVISKGGLIAFLKIVATKFQKLETLMLANNKSNYKEKDLAVVELPSLKQLDLSACFEGERGQAFVDQSLCKLSLP